MAEPALAVDQILAGTYKVVRRVGAGGMGEIYEATHARLAGRYAIKLLRPEIAATSDAYARFQREARVTSALRHPNIVQVVDFSQLDGDGAPFLVMEFLDGPELAQVMKRAGGPLPMPRVLSYVKQIASGLMAAHQNEVVHRDLKPQNIFVLTVAGRDDEFVKIVDFGISKVSDVSTTITSAMTVMGTAHYMSPEQARGRVDEIDARSDQFSLAIMVYEMLTGEDAFRGESIQSIVYQIVHEEPRRLVDRNGPLSAPVASVLKRALSKDRERRFSSVAAFSNALDEAAAAGAAELGRTMASTGPDEGSRDATARRRRALWIAAALALALGGAWVAARRGPPADARASVAATPLEAPPAAAPPAVPPAPTPPAPAPSEHAPGPAPQRESLGVTATRPVHVHPKPRPPVGPAVAASGASAPTKPTAPGCEPNFYLGPAGEKHFKPECFLEGSAKK